MSTTVGCTCCPWPYGPMHQSCNIVFVLFLFLSPRFRMLLSFLFPCFRFSHCLCYLPCIFLCCFLCLFRCSRDILWPSALAVHRCCMIHRLCPFLSSRDILGPSALAVHSCCMNHHLCPYLCPCLCTHPSVGLHNSSMGFAVVRQPSLALRPIQMASLTVSRQ